MLSMTGFGRAVFSTSLGKFSVEAQSVNRKYLEIWVSLPKELNCFEFEVRKWIGKAVSRGQIQVRVSLLVEEENVSSLPQVSLLKELKKFWNGLALEIGLDPKEINFSFLLERLNERAGLPVAQEKVVFPLLKEAVETALQGLCEMRRLEGKALEKDLTSRTALLENRIEQISQKSPNATEKQRKKLQERIREFFEKSIEVEVEERLLREIALFAERVDISEEISRLNSHICQFRTILKGGDSIGRKLDFLIQEIARELNTIGSKSGDSEISHLVVESKSELEKMREQVQNVE